MGLGMIGDPIQPLCESADCGYQGPADCWSAAVGAACCTQMAVIDPIDGVIQAQGVHTAREGMRAPVCKMARGTCVEDGRTPIAPNQEHSIKLELLMKTPFQLHFTKPCTAAKPKRDREQDHPSELSTNQHPTTTHTSINNTRSMQIGRAHPAAACRHQRSYAAARSGVVRASTAAFAAQRTRTRSVSVRAEAAVSCAWG